MTLRAVTSADLSWELSVIIYPAVFHRAKLMQFCPKKEGLTSFQWNHDENMGEGHSNVDVYLGGGGFTVTWNYWKSLFWNTIIECEHGCVIIIANQVDWCDNLHQTLILLYTFGLLVALYTFIIYWLRHRKRFVLYSVHIPIKLTACYGQLLLPRPTSLRVQPHLQLCESAVTLNSC